MAWKIFFRVLSIGRHERGLIAGMLASGILIALAQLLEPVLFGRVIDALAKSASFNDLVVWWIGLGIFNATLSIFLSVVSDRYAHRQRTRSLEIAFERTLHLPFHELSLQGSGKVIRTIQTGSDQVFFIVLSFFRENVIAIGNIIILVPLAFYLEPRLASVLFGLSAVYAVTNWLVIRKTFTRQAAIEVKHQEITGRLVDVMGNAVIIRSFNRFKDEIALFKGLTGSLLAAQYPVLYWWGVLNVMTRLMAMFAMVMIVGMGAKWVQAGLVSHGEIVTFVGFSTLLIARLEQVSSFVNRIVGQIPTAKNLFNLFDQTSSEEFLTGKFSSEHPVKGHVTFLNVSFHYRSASQKAPQGVLGLSFEVKAGQTVALVGPTGAGKSTCLALLQRLYVPDSGFITIDGCNIQTLEVAALSSAIATVFQEPGLLNRSVRENILMGRPGASDLEVEAAARMADAHDFIVNRPGGYDFIVGERGLALSGGERQRLAIARAMLKNAPILILDEATSALDYETEAKVQEAMDRLGSGKTRFIIAHRLSTILAADLILVMDHGKIIQAGRFEDLRKQVGLFSRLLAAGNFAADGTKTEQD